MIIPPTLCKGKVITEKGVTQTQTKETPIEFSHSEDFSVNIPKTSIEATDFKGSEFLDALEGFNQTGVNIYIGADLIPGSTAAIPGSGSLSDLVVNITES